MRSLPPRSRVGAALALNLLCLGGCIREAPPPSASQLPAEIQEASGMARSMRDPAIMWVHGDSGTPPTLYAVDAHGAVTARVEVASAINVDWEDMTAAGGKLYVGDIGNNSQARRDLSVLVVPEPDPRGGLQSVKPEARVPWRFPDQSQFPAQLENFDAEGLFWARGALHLLSKHRDDSLTTLYRFGSLDPKGVTLQALESFDVGGTELKYGGMVTAAEVNAAGTRLAVLSYHALFVFDIDHAGPLLARLETRTVFDMRQLDQCEAVAWRGETVVIVNERGRVFEIDTAARARGGPFPELEKSQGPAQP